MVQRKAWGRQGTTTTNLVAVGDTRGVNLNCGFYILARPDQASQARPLIKQLNMDYDSLVLATVELEIALTRS